MPNRKSSTTMQRRGRRQQVRLSKTPNDIIHTVSRSLVGSISRAASDTGSYVSFRLTDFPGASDFTSLFTQYRVKRVELKFMFTQPNDLTQTPTLYIAPQNYSASGVPANREEVLQFQGVRAFQFGPAHISTVISRKPVVFRDIGNQVSGGEIAPAPYLSTTNALNQHLGFVYWISRYNTTTGVNPTLDLEYTIHLDCKGTR